MRGGAGGRPNRKRRATSTPRSSNQCDDLRSARQGPARGFSLDRESDRRATLELVRGMNQHWFTVRSNHYRRILNRTERSGPLLTGSSSETHDVAASSTTLF